MITLVTEEEVVEWVEGECGSWIVRVERPFRVGIGLLLLS
jgi:hypothetical protein